jgi:hypothetical protein
MCNVLDVARVKIISLITVNTRILLQLHRFVPHEKIKPQEISLSNAPVIKARQTSNPSVSQVPATCL